MSHHRSPEIFPTRHRVYTADAATLSFLESACIDCVVTSPPYPMIAMWDESFSLRDAAVREALRRGDGDAAWRAMHAVLEPVWAELFRVLAPGAFLCLNIGDAVRTVNSVFKLYPNHSFLEQHLADLGFDILPRVIWRKTTNAPNKFMGSGVLPAGAYVTLEHEYILILRKPGTRRFASPADKLRRRHSALFWEERNTWYSDVWILPGVFQQRSAPGREPVPLPSTIN